MLNNNSEQKQSETTTSSSHPAGIQHLQDFGRLHHLLEEFESDLAPDSTLEKILIQRAAIAAACLEQAEKWELDILRELSAGGVNPWQPDGEAGVEFWGTLRRQLASSEALTKAGRYANLHFRRFTKSLTELDRLRRRQSNQLLPRNQHTEGACVELLRQRFESDAWQCPACGLQAGDWLPSRLAWECRNCHRQVGLRVGTVMENSPLPLATWAYGFDLLQFNPDLPTKELAAALGIARRETVRRLRRILLACLEDAAPRDGLLPMAATVMT